MSKAWGPANLFRLGVFLSVGRFFRLFFGCRTVPADTSGWRYCFLAFCSFPG